MSDSTVLDSIKDLTAYINGEPNTVTTRSYKLKKAPNYTGEDIKTIREKVGVSRPVFAGMLDVSVRTLERWEIDGAKPSGSTNRLIQLLDQNPTLIVNEIETASLAMG